MYQSLYEPLPDAGAYLARIGYSHTPQINRDTLDELVLAHLTHIPFENLDVFYLQQPVSLGIADLFDKVITRRRGGYCFELNGLFLSLLQSIGFSAYSVAARVHMGKTFYPPLSHRGIIVTLEGERYFCDVGFGGPCPRTSLRLDDSSEQVVAGQIFRFQKRGSEFCLQLKKEDGWFALFSFTDVPVDSVDFIVLSGYACLNPQSAFRSKRMVYLLTPDAGRIALENNELRRTGCDPIQINEPVELESALAKYFGIQLDSSFPL